MNEELKELLKAFPLKEQYALICKMYAMELNRMWHTDGEWINDNFGTFEVADCFIGNNELRILVDKKVDFETFYKWYRYDLAMHYGEELGKHNAVVINLEHWLMGFPEELKVPEVEWGNWEHEYFDSND